MESIVTRLKKNVSGLKIDERKQLMEYIKSSYSVFNEHSDVTNCPHCNSKNIKKNGVRNDTQRFLCKECHKTFDFKTNTVLKGLHKINKWNYFLEDFLSLKISTLKELTENIHICRQTAIDWRHKLLAVMSNRENKFKNDVVEFDESYFLISRKGRQDMNIENKKAYKKWRKSQVGDSNYNVKVFFSYGRIEEQLDLCVSHMGRTSAAHMRSYFLPSKFKNITTITDSHNSYKSFFKAANIEHETFISKDHVNKTNNLVHNQTVNAYTNEFKIFVNSHMKGVSTKYLNLYAKWFEFFKNVSRKIEDFRFNLTDYICSNVVSDNVGLELYRQSEYSFKMFLKNNNRTDYGVCKNHYYSTKL